MKNNLKIIFFHFPKTGGTTLRSILETFYTKDQIFNIQREEDFYLNFDNNLRKINNEKISLISGHYSYEFLEKYLLKFKYFYKITIYRNFFDRFFSSIFFFKKYSFISFPKNKISNLDYVIDFNKLDKNIIEFFYHLKCDEDLILQIKKNTQKKKLKNLKYFKFNDLKYLLNDFIFFNKLKKNKNKNKGVILNNNFVDNKSLFRASDALMSRYVDEKFYVLKPGTEYKRIKYFRWLNNMSKIKFYFNNLGIYIFKIRIINTIDLFNLNNIFLNINSYNNKIYKLAKYKENNRGIVYSAEININDHYNIFSFGKLIEKSFNDIDPLIKCKKKKTIAYDYIYFNKI